MDKICKICGDLFYTCHNAKACSYECKAKLMENTYQRSLKKRRQGKYYITP